MKGLLFALTAVAGALVAACGGNGASDIAALATEAADVEPASSFNVVAEDIEFDTDTLVAAAGQEIVIRLENRDSALHNIAVYTEEGGDVIFSGDLFSGPGSSREYRFQAPPPGVYYFRCDAHPEMEGVFITR